MHRSCRFLSICLVITASVPTAVLQSLSVCCFGQFEYSHQLSANSSTHKPIGWQKSSFENRPNKSGLRRWNAEKWCFRCASTVGTDGITRLCTEVNGGIIPNDEYVVQTCPASEILKPNFSWSVLQVQGCVWSSWVFQRFWFWSVSLMVGGSFSSMTTTTGPWMTFRRCFAMFFFKGEFLI